MRRLPIVVLLLFLFFTRALTGVHAESQRAYQDYLFQSDQYRRVLSEFTIAKNEYEKFKSLASETTALEKTKLMMTTRNALLRSYLLFLIDKLIENPGLVNSTRTPYAQLLGNELAFLEKHSGLIPSISSLDDAQSVSHQLESHYNILQVSIQQTITTLIIGNLNSLAISYDQVVTQAQSFVTKHSDNLPSSKRAIVDRWLLQIQSKRSLYQQKVDSINRKKVELEGSDRTELDRQAIEIQEEASGARQYLTEGTSFIGELITALKYED